MVLHKIVNGVKIDLSSEEEEKVKAEWAVNKELQVAEEAEQKRKNDVRDSAIAKVAGLAGLTDEEKELLYK